MLLAILRRLRSSVLLGRTCRVGTASPSRRLPPWILCRLHGVGFLLLSLHFLWNIRLQQLRRNVVLRVVMLLHLLLALWNLLVVRQLRNLFFMHRRQLCRLLQLHYELLSGEFRVDLNVFQFG